MEVSQGAKKVVQVCANVRPGEQVVVITDILRPAILGDCLAAAAEEAGGLVTRITYNGRLNNGQLSLPAEKAVEAADVLLCVTTKTLAYTKAVDKCKARGGRVIAITEATEATLSTGPIEADYLALQPLLNRVKDAFDKAEKVRVTAPGGTELTLSLKGRKAYVCSGICHDPGQLIGLPALEVYIAPVEDETIGRLVADASGTAIGLIKNPIILTIEKGRVTSIEGKEESETLKQILADTKAESSFVIAEFAIGLNPCGKLVGAIAEDEGLYGTGHFALGNNLGFGGKNDAPEHMDLVYWHPTIELDGEILMKNGILQDGNE